MNETFPEELVVPLAALRVPALATKLVVFPESGAPFSLNRVAVKDRFFPDPMVKLGGATVKEVEEGETVSWTGDIVPVELPWLAL